MYSSNNRKFGYNICEKGCGSIGREMTNDHRKKRNSKSVTFKNLSMYEKLKLAINYKEQYLISLRKNQ
jgi:hypothetical protein